MFIRESSEEGRERPQEPESARPLGAGREHTQSQGVLEGSPQKWVKNWGDPLPNGISRRGRLQLRVRGQSCSSVAQGSLIQE